ncbi:similar to ubiquitin carboxyl-terminal hydrolase [Plenodomus lingam JN3]|uniref:Similar to ubiquitin carboxyl-terminal hydrolase n=1 Tax=Leptosphaeria maculans (strain JN3 / isolate v23.1.3 / race Av1-4-5-6-7-8) TaxID=985895 RepID=E4ZI40_LEPMJ|nr:similar to ubiquitin carboxyl-terminal hydrolase [Plenodomus lingam JN3]CBX91183.1 similar to ubiquitin carboxyl-terminal hydrolase [Plenodomus lingam JN3]
MPPTTVLSIRETHRRKLDGPEVYNVHPESASAEKASVNVKPGKLEGLQHGILTYGLKEILDSLNERPIYRKTISPQSFIRSLERAFGTRVSRQQQDAQEFLQIVTERLCDEYHAGAKARRRALQLGLARPNAETASTRREIVEQFGAAPSIVASAGSGDPEAEEGEASLANEEGFPFEGKIESQIECLTCHFKPKPTVSDFVTLTLNVPQCSSTSLNECFDGMLKMEYIDDFKCEWCRLEHALKSKQQKLSRTTDSEVRQRLQSDIARLQKTLDEDPEHPPEDIELPDSSQAPKRRISRHMYISHFPKVIAVHLSRSMFAAGTVSTKNLAKVSFPEALPLGGLLHRKNYRLLGLVTHKGSHNSGHYESFRRQVQPLPFSTPTSFGTEGAYSRQASPYPSAVPSMAPSAMQSPRISATHLPQNNSHGSPTSPPLDSPSNQSLSSQDSLPCTPRGLAPTSAPRIQSDTDSVQLPPSSTGTEPLTRTKSIRSIKDKATEKATSIAESNPLSRKSKKTTNRWWRISDDKIKESKTSEVLGMQKEVYLLFYELDRS